MVSGAASATLVVLLVHRAAAAGGCSRLVDLDLEAAGYAPDHLNYLCTNWTRPTPLYTSGTRTHAATTAACTQHCVSLCGHRRCRPCKPAVERWQPRWGKRFMIFSWWQPLPSDYQAYADAGFNIALLRGDTWVNEAQEAAYAAGRGKEWHATHDGLFEAVLHESEQLAAHGVLSVFSQVNLAPDQKPRATRESPHDAQNPRLAHGPQHLSMERATTIFLVERVFATRSSQRRTATVPAALYRATPTSPPSPSRVARAISTPETCART